MVNTPIPFAFGVFLFWAYSQMPAYAEDVIANAPETSRVTFMRSFTNECTKQFGGAQFARPYCACATAFIADQFTYDEAIDPKIMSKSETMEKQHPGIVSRLQSCMKMLQPTE